MANEISFYEEICKKVTSILTGLLGDDYKVFFSYNKNLPQMISEIENGLASKCKFHNKYVPNLKLDILFGIKKEGNDNIELVLLEVKYLRQLSLKEYSQLLGYLLVGLEIELGILFLVTKDRSISPLSGELHEILMTGNLPMNFSIEKGNEAFSYKTGISYYHPGNGINWVTSELNNSINSFEDLADKIEQNLS